MSQHSYLRCISRCIFKIFKSPSGNGILALGAELGICLDPHHIATCQGQPLASCDNNLAPNPPISTLMNKHPPKTDPTSTFTCFIVGLPFPKTPLPHRKSITCRTPCLGALRLRTPCLPATETQQHRDGETFNYTVPTQRIHHTHQHPTLQVSDLVDFSKSRVVTCWKVLVNGHTYEDFMAHERKALSPRKPALSSTFIAVLLLPALHRVAGHRAMHVVAAKEAPVRATAATTHLPCGLRQLHPHSEQRF